MSSPMIPQKTIVSEPKSQFRWNSAFKQLWSIHWWMATCYLVLFVGGFWMVRMPDDMALQNGAYDLHKSFGALTMALLTWRIFLLQRVWWRKYTRRLPKVTGEWIRTFLLHAAIYIFMLAVPISGFFLSNSFRSNNVSFFWFTTLPDVFPQNRSVLGLARNLHFWISYTFLAFIVLHTIDQWKVMRSYWRRLNQALRKRLIRQS